MHSKLQISLIYFQWKNWTGRKFLHQQYACTYLFISLTTVRSSGQVALQISDSHPRCFQPPWKFLDFFCKEGRETRYNRSFPPGKPLGYCAQGCTEAGRIVESSIQQHVQASWPKQKPNWSWWNNWNLTQFIMYITYHISVQQFSELGWDRTEVQTSPQRGCRLSECELAVAPSTCQCLSLIFPQTQTVLLSTVHSHDYCGFSEIIIKL